MSSTCSSRSSRPGARRRRNPSPNPDPIPILNPDQVRGETLTLTPNPNPIPNPNSDQVRGEALNPLPTPSLTLTLCPDQVRGEGGAADPHSKPNPIPNPNPNPFTLTQVRGEGGAADGGWPRLRRRLRASRAVQHLHRRVRGKSNPYPNLTLIEPYP